MLSERAKKKDDIEKAVKFAQQHGNLAKRHSLLDKGEKLDGLSARPVSYYNAVKMHHEKHEIERKHKMESMVLSDKEELHGRKSSSFEKKRKKRKPKTDNRRDQYAKMSKGDD